MQKRSFVALILLGFMLALFGWGAATGQPLEAPVELEVEAPVDAWDLAIAALTVWLPRVVILCTLITAAFPSAGKIMAVVDVFAGCWGKARNDPAAQKWG